MNYEILSSFLVGGLLMSSTTYTVKYVEPALGALIWAAPIILLPSVILLWCNNVNNERIGNFIYMSLPYLILTVIWQISFIMLLKYTKYYNDTNGVIKVTIISLLIWLFFAYILYYFNFHKYLIMK